jgi:hypothetical protein
MKLYRVIKGCVVHDPKSSGLPRVWLMPGDTIDFDNEWVRDEIKGQEYKLEPAAPDSLETNKDLWPMQLLNRYRAWEERTAAQRIVEPVIVELEPARKPRKKKGDL